MLVIGATPRPKPEVGNEEEEERKEADQKGGILLFGYHRQRQGFPI